MRDRLDYVDGLRAAAVLAVVAFHSALSNTVLAPQNSLLTLLLKQGCHGVDLFFVVSGFCLSYPVLKHAYERGSASFDLCGYFARRILRIVPPYYAAMLVILALFALLKIFAFPIPPAMSSQSAYGFDAIISQMLFLDGRERFVNASFWTLCVEFRWYLLFPGLLWLWVRSAKAFALCLLALVVSYSLTRLNSVDVAALPAFMLGIFAAHLRLRSGAMVKWAAGLAVAGFLVGMLETPNGWQGYLTFPTELAAFGIFVAGGHIAVARRVLEMPALVSVGRYSYGIYLIHEPVVGLVNRLLAYELPAAVLITFAAMTGVGAGIAFSRIFEQPLLHGALRRRALDALEPALRRFWKSMPGERGVTLALAVPPAQIESMKIAV